MCLINNHSFPRLTWEQAQAVLEKHVQLVVAENDDFIEGAVELCRTSRHENGKESMALAKDWLQAAKEHRQQSRVMLATLETMMRGV